MSGAWPALVKAALLGTERTGRPSLAGAGGAVGTLAEAVSSDPERTPERALLAAAASVATARRAGQVAARPTVEAVPPSPSIDRPEVGEDAARTLAALVGGTWRQLLPEWLEACGGGGRRVPAALLPSVLDVAATDRSLRPAVLGALGERGRWLAAQRMEWRWAIGAAAGEVPDDPAAAWAGATAAERRSLLVAVRALDAGAGRSSVESTWQTDRADDRAAFVELLRGGLSMDDEPFLEERARLDRARNVRRAAAAALACLPASRLAGRMQQRAVAHVDLAARAVDLPQELPEDWVADGVERAARRGGERVWWLRQVVAATPLDAWGPAADAVPAAARADHFEAISGGWTLAATRQGRPDWASALLGAATADDSAALLRVLGPPDRAAWLAAALTSAPPGLAAALLPLTAEVPRPWPATLAHVAAGRAAAMLLGKPLLAHAARPVLLLAAERADPSALSRFAAELAHAMQVDRRLQAELRRPLAVAQMRADLLAELATL